MADALLQRLNTAAEGRLRQAYRLGGAVKTTVFNQRDKIAQLAEIEMHKLASQGPGADKVLDTAPSVQWSDDEDLSPSAKRKESLTSDASYRRSRNSVSW